MNAKLELVMVNDDVETSAEALDAPDDAPEPPVVEKEREDTRLGPGSLIDGRYELETVLGEGGYGVVYRARQLSTNQFVALKILRLDKIKVDGEGEHEIARFEREMQLIGKLNHPNIVKLIDFGTMESGQLYTVIEYIDGIDLATLLDQEGAMRPSEAKYLMTQVLEALGAAHALGIVYRDLKPQNIMITTHGVRRGVKLLDFGISGLIEDVRDKDYKNLTQDGKINGTPSYMAPEQLRALPPTPQTDIYAWGLVFLEMLLGHQVISDESYVEVLARQISSIPIEVPEELKGQPLGEILARAVAKPLDVRYPDVHEVLVDLEDCIVPQAMVLPWTGKIARSRIQESISVRQSRGRTPSGSVSSVWSASMRVDAFPASSADEVEAQEAIAAPAPASKRTGLIALLLLLLIGGGVAVVMMQSQGDSPSTETSTPPNALVSAPVDTKVTPPTEVPSTVPPTAVDSTTETPPSNSPPKTIEKALKTSPSDADVFLDGKALGQGLGKLAWPNDSKAHVLEVRADGYEDYRLELKVGELPPGDVSLEKSKVRRTYYYRPNPKPQEAPKEVKPVADTTPKENVKDAPGWDVKKTDLESPWK